MGQRVALSCSGQLQKWDVEQEVAVRAVCPSLVLQGWDVEQWVAVRAVYPFCAAVSRLVGHKNSVRESVRTKTSCT